MVISHIARCASILLIASTVRAQEAQPATPAGDATSGRALVQSGKCLDCHRIGDSGSRVGPNLSDIGSRRSPDRLMRAIVAPDDEVLPENRFVRVTAGDGASVQGSS
jgi:putative heme-binding domain-containing protein